MFTCSKGATYDDDYVLDNEKVTENEEKHELPIAEHMRRIKEASNKFLNVSGKLERVCPLKLHFGYDLYDCGAVCD